MSIHKARKNLADQKWIQISQQTCGLSQQAFGAVTDGPQYIGGVDCLQRRLVER